MSNPILNIIQSAFAAEIANDHQITPHAIVVNLPNKKRIIIGVILTVPSTRTVAPYPLRTDKQHTYHYLHQFTNATPTAPKPFMLQSLEDCRSYIEDVCRTFFNADFHDFEITFPDGSTYLVVAAYAENHNN